MKRSPQWHQKKFIQNASILAICVVLLIYTAPGSSRSGFDLYFGQQKRALGSLMCNDETLPAIEALSNSIRSAGHHEPFLVMVQSRVTSTSRAVLSSMKNTRVIDAEPLKYPFKITKGRAEQDKPCRFMKLQFWKLKQFSTIIFLDADVIVRKNIRELFDKPDFSAVKDPVGMDFNTGVLVIKPSLKTHQFLLENYLKVKSYNMGDQGTLNALINSSVWNPLPLKYNTFYTAPRRILESANIVHFSGDIKPWKFWKAAGKGVISFFAFLEWCKYIGKSSPNVCQMNGPIDERLLNVSAVPKYEEYSHETKISVLLSVYDRDSWRDLSQYYSTLDFVREVSVIWHKVDRPHPKSFDDKVHFIYPKADSLNNRFLAAHLNSDCVYVCDDDVKISATALKMGLRHWQQNPARLVGFFPRVWTSTPSKYSLKVNDGYNIVLTKGMFAHRAFLNAYSLLLPAKLTTIVTKNTNCEDILFNMMAVGLSGLPPIAIMVEEEIGDVGRSSGISTRNGNHGNVRDLCVDAFLRYGDFKSPNLMRNSFIPEIFENHLVKIEEKELLKLKRRARSSIWKS